MSKQILTNLDFNHVAKVINLPDPTSAQEAATKAYTDSAIATVDAALDAEIAARIAGDAAVDQAISDEVVRATAAEQALQLAIDQEVQRAQNAEATKLDLAGGTMTGNLTLGSGVSILGGNPEFAIESDSGNIFSTRIYTPELQSTSGSLYLRANSGDLVLQATGGNISVRRALQMGAEIGAPKQITGMADGTAADHAVNKGQLDAAIGALSFEASAISVVPAGNITQTDVQAALQELDNQKLALAGGTMSGIIDMGNNPISSLADGVAASDAATKGQVDAEATRAQGVESGLDSRLSLAELEIDTLQSDATALAARVTTAEGNITTLQGDLTALQGSLSSSEAALDARLDALEADPTTKTYVDGKFADAESYTDLKVAELVGAAPELLNTLEELASALQDDPNVVTALQSTVTANLVEAKAYADGIVATEASARAAADDALDARLDVLELDPVTKTYVDNKTAPASTTFAGVAEIATQAEVDAGTNATAFVTPETLANWASRIKKYAQTIGDGSANQIVVYHGINSLDVQVQVYRAASPYDTVECDIERMSADAILLRFASAPAANSFRVVVTG